MTYLTIYLLGAFLSSVLVHTCCEYAGSDDAASARSRLRKTVPAWLHFVGAALFSLAWPITVGMCIRHLALLVSVRKRKRGIEA